MFQFNAGKLAANELRVASFRCNERMSRPFSLDVVVTTSELDPNGKTWPRGRGRVRPPRRAPRAPRVPESRG